MDNVLEWFRQYNCSICKKKMGWHRPQLWRVPLAVVKSSFSELRQVPPLREHLPYQALCSFSGDCIRLLLKNRVGKGYHYDNNPCSYDEYRTFPILIRESDRYNLIGHKLIDIYVGTCYMYLQR